MTRTPTSNTWRIGARAKGLNGRLCKGARLSLRMGPSRSSGRPAPSTTRPSNSGPTITWRARSSARRLRTIVARGLGVANTLLSIGITRAPGVKPYTSVEGIRNKRSPENPTTSPSTARPVGNCTKQLEPTANLMPTASITKPATRVKRPVGTQGLTACTTSRQSLTKLCQCSRCSSGLFSPGSIRAQRGDDALPAALHSGVNVSRTGFQATSTTLDLRILNNTPNFTRILLG